MCAAKIASIDHTGQLTHTWIKELDELLEWGNQPRAHRLLKAVLRTLRDWLPHDEAADLAAQLPELLRGAFYEQWRRQRRRSRSAGAPRFWRGSSMDSAGIRW
jgi:uncharacterized protein (DUF2267 family)